MFNLILGVLLPFIGTTIGACFVFLLHNQINNSLEKMMLGFAGGVMIAASVWSLIIPAIEISSGLKELSFLPAVIGVLLGMFFLICIDKLIQKLHIKNKYQEENAYYE